MTYDVHVPKPSVEVTSTVAKVGHRSAPAVRVRVATSNIARYIAACEVPHLYARACPKTCVYAATVCVEGSAVGDWTVRGDTAAVEASASTAVCICNSTALFASGTDIGRAARCGV